LLFPPLDKVSAPPVVIAVLVDELVVVLALFRM